MAEEKMLGKISGAYFGLGSYQNAMLGLHLAFSGQGCGVHTSICAWDYALIEHTEHCKWTEESRGLEYAEIMRKLSGYLKEAKVDRVEKLVGIPVELTFEKLQLKSWRILTEVL